MQKTVASVKDWCNRFLLIPDARYLKGSERMAGKETEDNKALSDQEKRLIEIIHDIRYGELHIIVADGKPIRIEEIKKSIKL